MADIELVCPKCNQPMQEGFLHDRYGDISAGEVGEWVEGPIERSIWGLKLRRKRRLPVTAYRCRSCGYLEVHAK